MGHSYGYAVAATPDGSRVVVSGYSKPITTDPTVAWDMVTVAYDVEP